MTEAPPCHSSVLSRPVLYTNMKLPQ